MPIMEEKRWVKEAYLIDNASAVPRTLRMPDRCTHMCGWNGMYDPHKGASVIKQSKSDTIKYHDYMFLFIINLWSLSKFLKIWHLKGENKL